MAKKMNKAESELKTEPATPTVVDIPELPRKIKSCTSDDRVAKLIDIRAARRRAVQTIAGWDPTRTRRKRARGGST